MRFSALYRQLALLATLSMPAVPALAAYSQPASTIAAGGGETSSAAYTNLGVIGQPAVVGSSSSASYTANQGFLSVLGDGFKILYPVIITTPGTLTFSLMATTSGSQPLGISNTGSSSLAWTVTKGTPDNIFSFTPASGTNGGSVTVTANAASLTPGLYSNTLSVNGAGISQTAQVQLDLTVTPFFTYTLAVTLKLATAEKGGGTVTSTVPDSRLSCMRTGGTSDVTCQPEFPANSTVTLHQTPDSNTQWATWGAPGCGSDPSCQIVLNSNQGTDVTFPYAYMSKVNSSGNGYESLALAYGNAGAIDTIYGRAVTFTEILTLSGNKVVTFLGGRDAWYLPQNADTVLQGGLTVQNGSLTVDKLVIK